MKNELIIARYTNNPKRDAGTRLIHILQELNLEELAFRFKVEI